MKQNQGFTLIDLMVAVAIVGILTAIALPSYRSMVERGRLTEALDGLSAYRMRMEQAYHDNGNYGTATCAVAVPATSGYFSFKCDIALDGQGYLAAASGAGPMEKYAYTVDDAGNRVTTAFPGTSVPANCWMTRAGEC